MKKLQLVPANHKRTEIYVSNSKFVATASPAFSVKEAKSFINNVKIEFQDATHNVPAYIIGHPPSVIEHSSDDGEPAGTAGRPVLSILRGSKFGDIAIVITRYFGGTKLGTGGLVRAYSDAAREVLSILPRAQKISTITSRIEFPYRFYNQIERIIDEKKIVIVDREFGAEVHITALFPSEDYSKIEKRLTNTTSGQIKINFIERNDSTIMPV